MNAVLHRQITARRLDAPECIFLARDLERYAPRLSAEILDVSPIAIVIFRVRRHCDTRRVAGAANSHFDGEARQIGRVDANSIRYVWTQFWMRKR